MERKMVWVVLIGLMAVITKEILKKVFSKDRVNIILLSKRKLILVIGKTDKWKVKAKKFGRMVESILVNFLKT